MYRHERDTAAQYSTIPNSISTAFWGPAKLVSVKNYLAGWLEGLLQVLGQKPQPVHLLLAQREVQLHAAVAAAAAAARIADAWVVVVPAAAAAVVAAVAAAVVAAVAAVDAAVVAALDLDGRLAQLTAQGEQLLFKLLQPLQRLLGSAHLRIPLSRYRKG